MLQQKSAIATLLVVVGIAGVQLKSILRCTAERSHMLNKLTTFR
ncbi:hypothetical protein [Microcoleus sp. FACHB-831]|nr:hypothetical protein [Microcoleus sp. FACHB-831]